VTLQEIDTAVQELRVEQHHRAFTHTLAHVVTALGDIPDNPPEGFTTESMVRLRQLVDEAVEAIDRRIDAGGDAVPVLQQLAGTIYEIRRRMESIEQWFRHRESA
jgi:hypothetical protein